MLMLAYCKAMLHTKCQHILHSVAVVMDVNMLVLACYKAKCYTLNI